MIFDPTMGLAVIEDTATKSFDVLLDKGVLGLFAAFLLLGLIFAGLVIRFLYNEGRAREKEYSILLERVVTLTEGVKNTGTANTAILERVGVLIDGLRTAIDGLGRELERNASDVRHSSGNHSQGLNSIASILEKLPEKVADRLHSNGRG